MFRSTELGIIAALALLSSPVLARGGGHSGYAHSTRSITGIHTTHSYTRSTGTYVDTYHATNPNGTKNDNFSTRGKVNPFTGKAGTKPRDGEH